MNFHDFIFSIEDGLFFFNTLNKKKIPSLLKNNSLIQNHFLAIKPELMFYFIQKNKLEKFKK